MFIYLQDSRDWKFWRLSKVRTRPAGRLGDFGDFLIVFTKAHTYYPTYDMGTYFSDRTLVALC